MKLPRATRRAAASRLSCAMTSCMNRASGSWSSGGQLAFKIRSALPHTLLHCNFGLATYKTPHNCRNINFRF
jgi:hypothetical protein